MGLKCNCRLVESIIKQPHIYTTTVVFGIWTHFWLTANGANRANNVSHTTASCDESSAKQRPSADQWGNALVHQHAL